MNLHTFYAGLLQMQFHKQRALNRIVVVRLDFLKTQPPVKANRFIHPRRQRVEPHALVSQISGFTQKGFD
jgi:hypothetical protein